MAYVKTVHEGHTLEIQREVIDVTPMAEPDPAWTYTDRAGHTHGYTDGAPDGPYTTLEYRTVHDHADDGECDADGNQEFCYPVLVCKRCAQPVRPGTRAPLFRQNMPGMTTYLIDGEPVSKQAADDFMAAAKAEQRAAGNYTQRIATESIDRQGLFVWLSKVVGKDDAKRLIREAWVNLDGGVVAYTHGDGPDQTVYRPEEIKIVRTWDE
jgi:hypothetical protein